MTRKHAALIERRLKGLGVYRPYVSADSEGRVFVESYPLTAVITHGACDPEFGPAECVKVTDCTLARIGQDSTVTTSRVFIGQDVIGRVSEHLTALWDSAHARSVEQDYAALQRTA